ncbi:hypothetical protein F0562_000356 [Nyssa sinensis]|uniref:Uncharacterized protein n=1 Tax=Nyssa sinensis TaxID=561372 RepID=A0A5J5C439_9ASTE|nr:hypothetical protein F0562_000356 [Nyssa sinensis]
MRVRARLASLENHIHLLQEEGRWRKKDFEEELDKAVKAQFEVFILQKFLQDMEEKNYSLLIECQKHAEASKLTEKLISELESENLEQQVEAELLLDEIETLRMGIFQVFKALEICPDNGCEYTRMISNKLWVENSVLQTLLGQLKLEGLEIESEKKILEQELKTMTTLLAIEQNEKHELLEMNRQLRSEVSKGYQQVSILEAEMESLCVKQGDLQRDYLELQEEYSKALEENRSLFKKISDLKEEKCMVEDENNVILLETLAFSYLSVIFKSYGTEKAVELNIVSGDLRNLQWG